MSAKQDAAKARKLLTTYIDALDSRLGEDKCPAAVLAEARKFLEGQGIALEDPESSAGKTPAEKATRNRLRDTLDRMKQSG